MYRTEVNDEVKELIQEIIAKNRWEPVFKVKYYPGTEAGDGYASKHVAVDVICENDKTHKLFVKYAHANSPNKEHFDRWYQNEAYFYDCIYPTYAKFLKEKGVEDGFNQVPKCHGTSAKSVIVLENIKQHGYVLFDRTQMMNEEHMAMIFKNFAKYHAISFSFKDQHKEEYEELASKCQRDTLRGAVKDSPAQKMWRSMIVDTLAKFDQERDKRLINKCNADELIGSISGQSKSAGKYSVIVKGDCWSNNMMFLYGKDDKETPIEVIQVDWQLVQPASLVYDLSYFFYTTASEEALAKLDTYLDIYYTELCREIKRLGSDPDVLYPRSVFDDEWKRYCKYGFTMCFMLFRMILAKKDELPQMEKMDLEKPEDQFLKKLSKEDEYTRRIRVLTEFMVDKDYL